MPYYILQIMITYAQTQVPLGLKEWRIAHSVDCASGAHDNGTADSDQVVAGWTFANRLGLVGEVRTSKQTE